jgi:hypothetical protein
MRRSNCALRVPPILLAEARQAAESEGVALSQLITLALAEKVSAMRSEEYFEERARRADSTKVSQILARVGKGNPPVEGDELPSGGAPKKVKRRMKQEGEFFADWHRPHASLGLSPPISRSRLDPNNLLRLHI